MQILLFYKYLGIWCCRCYFEKYIIPNIRLKTSSVLTLKSSLYLCKTKVLVRLWIRKNKAKASYNSKEECE